jgi:hypothetical protein
MFPLTGAPWSERDDTARDGFARTSEATLETTALATADEVRPAPFLRAVEIAKHFGTLGVRESGKVNDLIKSLKVEGRTTLLTSHNVEQVFQLAERGYAGCNKKEGDQ